MKHCILVKFKAGYAWKEELQNIQRIFDSIEVVGVHQVEYIQNCIDRANRYDLLIRLDMDKESLPLYDESKSHHEWKDTYSEHIEKKAIFDYE